VAVSNTGFLYDSVFLKHDTGLFHPECPDRLLAIHEASEKVLWHYHLHHFHAQAASPDQIALVHDPGYVELVREECLRGQEHLSTGDTAISSESYEVALRAAGGIISVVDAVLAGRVRNAFCAVRPPGHHATARQGMGFCIFNNVAIAARYAQKAHGVERVLIVDWDVHHGNGTQDIFYRDDTVFFVSTHQYPLYPGTGHHTEIGEGRGKGFTLNRPFPAGTGDREILGVFLEEVLPLARRFRPDLTLISAGFDSRVGDPLGAFRLTDRGYGDLTKIMLEAASVAGNGRLISLLEGGYSPSGLASAVTAHINELAHA
jgi:acetoin utilization deacetylase AcuC-like enzyme